MAVQRVTGKQVSKALKEYLDCPRHQRARSQKLYREYLRLWTLLARSQPR